MDLIYTDENRRDVGILSEYSLDLAFGKDENDFELEMSIESACLKENYYIYIEDTQYGGIIDSINPSTSNKTVKYTGRTWHGIMDSKILVPDKGQDYLIVDGDANNVIRQLVARCGLNGLFTVEEDESDIEINDYSFPRYIGFYQGLRRMLTEFGGKLNLSYSDGKVLLSAVPCVDYTKNEEWDTSDMAVEINKHFNPVNHLYCLGGGNLKDRKIIELFTDGEGDIQPYSTVDEPYKDSQYILDSRNQKLTGISDNSEVYDYSNAQTAENYEVLTAKPGNWPKVYPDYYEYDSANDTYKELEREYEESYELLTSKPYDWNYAYPGYYYKDDEGEYKNVDDSFLVKETTYPLLRMQPADWKKNYKNYYYYWTDGVEGEYRSVEGVKYNDPKKQGTKPTDWDSNKGNYYIEVEHWDYTYVFKKKRNGVWDKWEVTYHDLKVEEFTKKDYTCKLKGKPKLVSRKKVKISDYVRDKDNKAKMSGFKSWKNSKYRPFYTMYTKEKAPTFDSSKHRIKVEATSSPEFKNNTFYKSVTSEVIPSFWVGGFFNKVYDNYADLVSNGISKLQEYWSLDNVNISLDSSEDYEYDVGDIVGATETITGITVTSAITKKIVNIDGVNETIQYELGNEDTTNTY